MDTADKKAEIWYLYNSGFAVKTANHFFIFDYYLDTAKSKERSLDCGVINAADLKEENVTVFVSHWHPDHFNPVIFDWRQDIKNIRYVLSYDIKKVDEAADAVIVHADQEYTVDDISVRVLQSTDTGVAFLIKADGLCIYHAGDLNWWHWNGEPDEENIQMAKRYKGQINKLKNEHIDIAFVPVDPRLEENHLLGLDYFMEVTDTVLAIPMHFGDEYSICDELQKEEGAEPYRDKVARITRRGEHFIYK